MPKVSVILPVYNSEKYIREAVQSILNQTFTDFELLIFNDASTDNTLNILREFKDSRIQIINNEVNLRVVKTLNKGLDLAKGEFIARMDADDIAHAERFSKQLNYFKNHPQVDFCGTWVQNFGAEDLIMRAAYTHDNIKARLLFLNPVFHPSVMFKRDSFKKYNLRFDESFTNAEDYGLWADAIDVIKFANVPEVLLKYRIHAENVSVLKSSNQGILDEIHFRIYSNFFRKLNVDYNQKDLVLHRKLALVSLGKITLNEFKAYLSWLNKLFIANSKSAYFDEKALANVIISFHFYLIRKVGFSFATIKALFSYWKSFKTFYFINYFIDRFETKAKPVHKF